MKKLLNKRHIQDHLIKGKIKLKIAIQIQMMSLKGINKKNKNRHHINKYCQCNNKEIRKDKGDLRKK